MRKNNIVNMLAALVIVAPTTTLPAELGEKYTSYRNLHRDTDYGSLFLNVGHFRVTDSRHNKDFREILGDGNLQLPEQRGYCFVLNHFGSPNGPQRNHYYSWKIEKTSRDGQITVESDRRSYDATDNIVSGKLPDLCISGLRNVATLQIAFSSTDGTYFDRSIVIDLHH
jgi:hypothetical protein